MKDILLTIGIPSIPSRIRMGLEPLFCRLESQIGGRKDVEILSILDNKAMTIGRKRQALFQLARGKYSCIIDDDDDFSEDFIQSVLSVIESDQVPDVITYEQECDLDGRKVFVIPSIKHKEETGIIFDSASNREIIKRKPWHWCCWKTSIARECFFYDTTTSEDGLFAEMAKEKSKTEVHISKPLVKYIYRQSQSATGYFQLNEHQKKAVDLRLVQQNGLS